LVHGWQHARRRVGDAVVISSFPPAWQAVGERAADISADAVSRYDAHFGAYPYTELDVLPVTASGFEGVEYPGLIMIGKSYYQQTQKKPGIDMQDVVVHEVAHQWWYNVVGDDQLREPWLDE